MGTDNIGNNFSHIAQYLSRLCRDPVVQSPRAASGGSGLWERGKSALYYVFKSLFHDEKKVPWNVYFHVQVDIWAIGCLYAEMLTGDPIFPGDSDIDQIYHITKCFGDSLQFIDPKCHRYLTHMTAGLLCPRHKELIAKNPIFNGTNVANTQPTGLKTLFPTW